VFRKLSEDNVIVEKGATVRSPSHEPRLGIEQQKNVDGFLRTLAQSPYAPPGEITLDGDLLNLLVEQGKVVKVGNGVVLDAAAYQKMVAGVVARIGERGKVTLAEVRDLFGTSRKYAQAFLEHLDEKKVTRRMGDERVLWGHS
jgi:selenocysteine-specific elongation factor